MFLKITSKFINPSNLKGVGLQPPNPSPPGSDPAGIL